MSWIILFENNFQDTIQCLFIGAYSYIVYSEISSYNCTVTLIYSGCPATQEWLWNLWIYQNYYESLRIIMKVYELLKNCDSLKNQKASRILLILRFWYMRSGNFEFKGNYLDVNKPKPANGGKFWLISNKKVCHRWLFKSYTFWKIICWK